MNSPSVYHADRPFYQVDSHYYDPKVIRLIDNESQVIDIGCGRGGLLSTLRDNKNCQVIGLDISPEAIEICRGKNIPCICGNFEVVYMHIPPLDYAIMVASLEHMIDPKEALLKTNGLLRQGGYVIIGVPNFSFWLWRWYYLRGKNAKKFSHPSEKAGFLGIQSDGHLQMFTVDTLTYLLKVTGFEPVEWVFDRARAKRSVKPDGFKGLLGSIRRMINNYLWVPFYNAMPYRALACNFIIVKAQKR